MSNTNPTSDTEESPIDQPMAEGRAAGMLQTLTRVGDPSPAQDFVATRRAFQNTYACETADGGAFIGAVKVEPASKGMVDDLEHEVLSFAGALTASAEGSGMLVDVPRQVDHRDREAALRGLAERFDENADACDDPNEKWSAQVRADLAEEEATAEWIYDTTTTARDHYIVLRVDKVDAAESLTESENTFADAPVIGGLFTDKNLSDLAESDRLHRQMKDTLEMRLERLARRVRDIDGVDAHPISSTRLSAVLARYYRTDNPDQIANFRDLIRQSPIPGDQSSVTSRGVTMPAVEQADGSVNPLASTSAEDRAAAYQSLLAPQEPVSIESDGAFEIGDRAVASILVTAAPARPPDAFLEPLYQYDNSDVEVTIATHFERMGDQEAKRDAKNAENSLSDMLDGKAGGVLEDAVREQAADAEEFSEAISTSDYGVFETVTVVTVSASPTVDEDGPVPARDVLDAAVDHLIETELKGRCGVNAKRLDDAHHDGWQATAPAAENTLGTNMTMRADALAAQFPYRYRNLDEPGGIRVGLHNFLREASRMNVFDGRPNGYNIGVYGMIGSGKTTTVQDLALKLYLKHQLVDDDLTVVLSTPLRDFQGLAAALGGERVVVGGGTGINPQAVRYVPPADLRAVGEETRPWQDMLERLSAFLESYYELEGLEGFGTKKSSWMRAAKQAHRANGIDPQNPATYENESATLQDTIDNLLEMRTTPERFARDDETDDPGTLENLQNAARDIVSHDIEPFRDDGQFSHFTEQSELDLGDYEVLYLDFKNYDGDDQMAGLEMQMRLSDLYEQAKRFDGRTFFAVDEFAKMLSNPKAKQFFDHTHRHSRHWDLSVCLATQQFGDLFVTNEAGDVTGMKDSAETIMNNQAMQFYHFTNEMSDKWSAELDLSERSAKYIDSAQTGDSDVGYAQALAVVDGDEFPLRIEMSDDLNPRSFGIYRHDPTEHPPIQDYLRDYGDDEDTCNWRWT